MFFYLGQKIHVVEDKIRLLKNKSNAWKYGYNKEFDIVIISKNGTLGNIFIVNGLKIGLPEKPEHKEIINWDKTPGNQYWRREEMPNGLTERTQNKHIEYIEREYDRRENGLWVYINGKEVYLSRTYYYFIQWIREGNKYPSFRIIQNELMLYWEACKADERCFGICFVKPRRFGWSVLGYTQLLEAGTSEENKMLGIVSKKGADAKKIFNRMVRSFKRLPFFFMPELDGTTTPKSDLIFAEQSRKRKVGENVIAGQGLDTSISWHNTEINAMDGDEIFFSLLDEVGKFPKDVPFSEYWSIVQTSHTVGSEIIGKAMVGSTVNAMKKGGAEFKSVYKDSDPHERMESGETKSGLYRLFIPARYCLAGFFDVFGFSITQNPENPFINDLGKQQAIGSVEYLKNKLDALKGKPEKYNERLRQFPNTDTDAFRDEASDCEFNLKKILEQLDYNDEDLNDKYDVEEFFGNDQVDRGTLIWANGELDTEVIWKQDLENGDFFIKKGCHPPLEFRNKKEMKMVNGNMGWTPLAGHVGCFGADPYNRDKGADGRGSKGSISGSTKTNTSDLPNEEFFLEYIARARTVTEFFENVIKACVYYSMPVLGELSNEAFLEYLKNRGYRNYSMNNPFKKYNDLSPTEKKIGGAPAQDSKIADQQMYAIEAYIENQVGYAEDDSNREKGKMGTMVFTRTLNQWKDVELNNRTKYDAYISSSLSRIGNQRVQKTEEVKPTPMRIPFKKYDNSGNVSIAL